MQLIRFQNFTTIFLNLDIFTIYSVSIHKLRCESANIYQLSIIVFHSSTSEALHQDTLDETYITNDALNNTVTQ